MGRAQIGFKVSLNVQVPQNMEKGYFSELGQSKPDFLGNGD